MTRRRVPIPKQKTKLKRAAKPKSQGCFPFIPLAWETTTSRSIPGITSRAAKTTTSKETGKTEKTPPGLRGRRGTPKASTIAQRKLLRPAGEFLVYSGVGESRNAVLLRNRVVPPATNALLGGPGIETHGLFLLAQHLAKPALGAMTARGASAFAYRESEGDVARGLFTNIRRTPARSQKAADREHAESEHEAREHRAGDHRGFPMSEMGQENHGISERNDNSRKRRTINSLHG
jgi:hypothetical protein